VLPGNASVISGFWILYLDLLDKLFGGITINYNTQSYCKHTALIIHRLIPYFPLCSQSQFVVLFARFCRDYYSLITELKLSLHSLLVYYYELNWLVLNWLRIFPESRYIASAPTAQKIQLCCLVALTAQKRSHAACYCCVATNCRRDVLTSALRSNEHETLVLLLLRACVEVSAFQQFPHGANTHYYILKAVWSRTA
jgi:hypothetical protein